MIDLNSTQQETKSDMSIGKLLTTHAFDYIVLRANLDLTSFEDLAMALE